jgi:hypothetical protein
MRRRRVKHGARARNGGEASGWGKDVDGWDLDFLKAFEKRRASRKSAAVINATDDDEAMKVALLVASKAQKLGIKAERAGKLAALLADDFRDTRVQLMQDLIENPNVLEAARTVWLEEQEGRDSSGKEEAGEEGEAVEGEVEAQGAVEEGAPGAAS